MTILFHTHTYSHLMMCVVWCVPDVSLFLWHWTGHIKFHGVECLIRMDHVSLMNLIFPISSVMWSGTWWNVLNSCYLPWICIGWYNYLLALVKAMTRNHEQMARYLYDRLQTTKLALSFLVVKYHSMCVSWLVNLPPCKVPPWEVKP